ncbi:MAG: M48 family metallopeptidase [Flavobacteriales bacterium]|nr:M48 family metallopeptidase [Flavobacteriales bacterium]
MRQSIFRDLVILLAIFAAGWLGFTYISILPEENVFEISPEKEQELGEKMVENIINNDPTYNPILNKTLDSAMNLIQNRLFDAQDTALFTYHIRVINNSAINAYTLPGGYIFVFTGLIEFTDTPEELAAVIAHEIGHVEERHLMMKMMKELGMAVVFSGDLSILNEVGRTAISTMFDRKNEEEADDYALNLLQNANIDPRIIATFFRKLKEKYGRSESMLDLLSTHPHSNSRIKTALEYKVGADFESVPFDLDWDNVKNNLRNDKDAFEMELDSIQ